MGHGLAHNCTSIDRGVLEFFLLEYSRKVDINMDIKNEELRPAPRQEARDREVALNLEAQA